MALWQYKIHAIPEEELESYFKNKDSITIESFDNIEWWKYRTYGSLNLNAFDKLSTQKSWSKSIKQLGDLESDCVEIFEEKEKIIEISIRIDLRKDYNLMVKSSCEFAKDNQLYFLNYELKVLAPNPGIINHNIKNYTKFERFLKFNQ